MRSLGVVEAELKQELRELIEAVLDENECALKKELAKLSDAESKLKAVPIITYTEGEINERLLKEADQDSRELAERIFKNILGTRGWQTTISALRKEISEDHKLKPIIRVITVRTPLRFNRKTNALVKVQSASTPALSKYELTAYDRKLLRDMRIGRD